MNVAVTEPTSGSMTVTFANASVGIGSSSVIVPVPWLSAIVAFVGFDRLAANVSSNSSRVSPTMGTVKVLVRTPGANESVPAALV